MITMEVSMQSSQSQVTFQLDTEIECNLLLLKIFNMPQEVDLAHVKCCSHKFIKVHQRMVQDIGIKNAPYTVLWEKKSVNITDQRALSP